MKNIFLLVLTFCAFAFGKTSNQVWTIPNGATNPDWGTVNLGSSAAVSGILPQANGGTAATNITSQQQLWNTGFAAVPSGSSLQVSLTQADGASAPSSSSPVNISFRGTVSTSAGYSNTSFTSALSTTLPSACGLQAGSTVQSFSGGLTSGNVCIASISYSGVVLGQLITDSSHPTYITAGTYVAGLPGTCSSGQIQMSAVAQGTSTDTLNFTKANTNYVYILQDSPNDMCVAGSLLDETALQSASAVSGCTSSSTTLYCNAGHSASPIRLLGTFNAVWNGTGWWSPVYPTQIGTGTVGASQLLPSAVGTSQIAANAVTQAKRVALGYAISSASTGTFSGSAQASPTNITNATVTITTTGRPVFVGLISDGTGSVSSIGSTSATASTSSFFDLYNGSSYILTTELLATSTGSSAAQIISPASSLWTIDTTVIGTPGTYTYTLRYTAPSGTTTTCYYANLIAYEL